MQPSPGSLPTPLIDGPRFYGNRACPGVSLSADITQGWGPETMLLSSPPPGVYNYKVRQYSAAGSLRHAHLPLLSRTLSPLTFASASLEPSCRSTAPHPSRSCSAPPPTAPLKACPAARMTALNPRLTSYYQVASGTSSRSLLRQTAR
jgi:hypothetical protein